MASRDGVRIEARRIRQTEPSGKHKRDRKRGGESRDGRCHVRIGTRAARRVKHRVAESTRIHLCRPERPATHRA